jgi:dolichol-phosphate mannosyltransferase
VVYAVRVERKGEGVFKKMTAALYYRFLRRITHIDMPLDAGDFRLLSRNVVDALKCMHEKKPFLRGLISWMGFRQAGILITREARFAGQTKYPLRKMLAFAWSGITHFSFFPLQLATWIGFVTLIYCVIEFVHTLYVSVCLKIAVPGWASIMVTVLFLGSVQLITLGIIGSYLSRTYDETRNRPLYLIREKQGL